VSVRGGASGQCFGIQLQVEAGWRAYVAEVVDLAALPEASPTRVIFTLGIPLRTHVGINAEVDGEINEVNEFLACSVYALYNDQLCRRNGLGRCQPTVVGAPVVRPEGGGVTGS